ncbi:hypothetical protein [Actibacterium ureilyticum]|uniref:hypothetical protein n=1 Tax=Actibacterium ureilyticum TaxID=1590614 RepID=UPI000BAAC9C9|nr:hypothetical protein [Actibacterium ureilyticum]
MKTVILALGLSLFALPAAARDVVVRSGAHPGFSRIVMEFPDPVDWSYQQDGAAAILTFETGDRVFDFTKVFDRIGRQRIARIGTEGDKVRIVLDPGCACSLDLFELRPGLLVADARDNGVAPARPDLLARPQPPAPQPAPAAPPQPAPDTTQASPRTALARPELPVYGAFGPESPPPTPVEQPPAVDPALAANADTRQAVAEMQARLVEQLGRAAAQGLVHAELPFEPAEPAPVEGEEAAAAPPDATPSESQLEAKTSIDRDLGTLPFVATTDLGRPCLDDSLVTMSAWGGDTEFGPAIAAGRRALYGEFDVLNADAARTLAHSYLYYGFGAEAVEALNLSGAPSPEDRVLQQIARLVDGAPGADPAVFQHQIGCASPAAMWAALALPDLPAAATINQEAIVLSFSDLPPHGRQLLGPRLIEIFINAGDLALAAHLRQAITRTPGHQVPPILDAALSQAQGQTTEAESSYAALSDQNATDAPKAMIALFDGRWARGAALDPDQIATAEALAFELRDTETGHALNRAAILSLARNGDFDAVFRRLSAQKSPVPPGILDAVATELIAQEDDTLFLHHALAHRHALAPLPGSLQLDIAARLLGLGFADAASAMIDQAGDYDRKRSRLLRAEHALVTSEPETALTLLQGTTGPKAGQLRARALTAAGQWDRAAATYRETGDTANATRAAWHAGRWDGLTEDAPEAQRAMADYVTRPAPAVPPTTPSLAAAQDQLSQSAELRAVLSQLLPAPQD